MRACVVCSHTARNSPMSAKPRRPRPFIPRLERLEDRLGPNVAPVLTVPAQQSSSEGQSISLQVQASDADGDSLTYSAPSLPSGLSLNPSTGLISGILGYTASGFGQYQLSV